MAYSFGGGVRPELGRTDFTPFLQGSVRGAEMQARGAENMAAGVSQFLTKAGEGVKAYQENKAINTMFNGTIDDAIALNEQGNGALAGFLGISNPSDRGAWAAGIKSLGGGDKKEGSMAVRRFMMQIGMDEAQRTAQQGAMDRRAGIIGGGSQAPGQAPGQMPGQTGPQQGVALNSEALIGLATQAAIEGNSEESKRYFDMAQSLNTQDSQTLRDFRRIAGRDPESIEEFQKFKQSGAHSVYVNTGEGGVPLGSPPPGMEWARTESGDVAMELHTESGYMRPVAVPIKGGQVERDTEAERIKTEGRRFQAEKAARTVTQDIGRAMDKLSEVMQGTGLVSAFGRLGSSKIPGTAAYELNKFIESFESNIGLDVLGKIREFSPTGGALGQIPVQQQLMLQRVYGSFDLGQSPEIIMQNLQRIQNLYYDVIHGTKQEREALVTLGKVTRKDADRIDSLYHDLPFDESGRRGSKSVQSPQQDKVEVVNGVEWVQDSEGNWSRKR